MSHLLLVTRALHFLLQMLSSVHYFSTPSSMNYYPLACLYMPYRCVVKCSYYLISYNLGQLFLILSIAVPLYSNGITPAGITPFPILWPRPLWISLQSPYSSQTAEEQNAFCLGVVSRSCEKKNSESFCTQLREREQISRYLQYEYIKVLNQDWAKLAAPVFCSLQI